jgi:cell shape-determining protein MreD
MRINSFRFIIFILCIAIIQQIVNTSTPIYVDCLGAVLVALLITDMGYRIKSLVILATFADLIGHWYFGTHLLAIILLSFISKFITNYYRICNSLQKTIICGLFYAILLLTIGLIGIITHNNNFSWISFIVEISIINPIILWLLHLFIIKTPLDIISMDY